MGSNLGMGYANWIQSIIYEVKYAENSQYTEVRVWALEITQNGDGIIELFYIPTHKQIFLIFKSFGC